MSALRIVRRLANLLDVSVASPQDGDVLTYDAGGGEWFNTQPTGGGGGGAPTTADYLVGTADAGLSNEIPVGTTPGGELGGTWAAPTVDAVHSGSSHAATQAAAEATAATALANHEADTTNVHGVADTSALYRAGGTDVAVADGGTGASTAANARTNLGLGTAATANTGDFDAAGAAAAAQAASQPLDSDLTAIAALSTTSFGRGLLALADAAAGRTSFGLGGLATLSAVGSSEITDGSIVNADVSASAAIAYSKLALGSSIVSADIVDGTIVNGDVNASAAIAYSKLALAASIVNADISTSAAIAYSKLSLATSLVAGDLSTALALSLAGWTVVTKTLDETVTGSTTLQDDDELFFTAANGTSYQVMFEIIYVSASGAGTPDLKIAIGEDSSKRGAHYMPSFTSTDNAQIAPIFSDLTSTAVFGTSNINRAFMSIGTHVGAGGTFKLQWAQNTSSGSPNGTTIKAGSRLRYRAI